MVTRRGLIATTALATTALGAAACTQSDEPKDRAAANAPRSLDPSSWASVKAQFPLSDADANFAAFVFASHPASVRDATAGFAASPDRDPVGFLASDEDRLEKAVADAAHPYLGGDEGGIAFTDSTTAGLGLLYSGLKLAPGD